MANITDALNAVCDYLEAKIPEAKRIVMSFPDERVSIDDADMYPAIAVSIYDAAPAYREQHSGVIGYRDDQPDGQTTLITKPPTPIDVFFQVDTLCNKRSDDQVLFSKCLQVLHARGLIIPNANGKDLHVYRGTMFPMDEIERESLFRKSFRFSSPVWFDHPDAATSEYLVLKAQLDMQNTEYEVKVA